MVRRRDFSLADHEARIILNIIPTTSRGVKMSAVDIFNFNSLEYFKRLIKKIELKIIIE